MRYRVCKSFEVESGHMLSKHPSRCRFPHGHSRRIDVVVSSDRLDDNDMVCDFKALKLALGEFIDRFDHATCINSDDPALPELRSAIRRARSGTPTPASPAGASDDERDRLVVFEGVDPTTEVMAERIFRHLERLIADGSPLTDDQGNRYHLPAGLVIERVRVGETSSSWAEFGI